MRYMYLPLYLLIAYLFFFPNNVFSQKSDTIIIKPGIGINNIKLHKSSQTKVKKYKNAKYIINKSDGIADMSDGNTFRNRNATYTCEELGVFFEYYTPWVKGGRQGYHRVKLCKITISKKAKTLNGLIIGKSTRQDVVKLYGQPSLDVYEEYLSEGIGFRYDKNGIISGVEVFIHAVE